MENKSKRGVPFYLLFKDFTIFLFQTTPCKHPIIILKDTGRDEASAMLEFAYTGEVNVAQELLPSLLQTARSFRIKGLDKVENPVEPPPRVRSGLCNAQYRDLDSNFNQRVQL